MTEIDFSLAPQYVEKWINLYFNTAPFTADTARSCVDEMYTCAGLQPPEELVILDSPLSAYFATLVVASEGEKGRPVKLRDPWDKLLVGPIEHTAQVMGVSTTRVLQALRGARSLAPQWFLGQNVYWFANYDFLRVFYPKEVAPLSGSLRYAEQVGGWALLFERGAAVSRRPIHCEREVPLSRTDGPVLEYADGFKVFHWEGRLLPWPAGWEAIEHPDHLTVEKVFAQRNVEVLRLYMQQYGYERLLDHATRIHSDEWGVLWHFPQQDVRVVEVQNATVEPVVGRRRFFLEVEPTVTTAHAAVASTFGLPPELYAPNYET